MEGYEVKKMEEDYKEGKIFVNEKGCLDIIKGDNIIKMRNE